VTPFPRLWQQLLMLFLNTLALLHLILITLVIWRPWMPSTWRLPAALAVLFLLPPVLARLVTVLTGLKEGRIPMGSKAFFAWWAVSNLQLLFNRLPALEECLRMVPGLYGLWLRLWGSRVSPFVYWAPGLRILDRGYVDFGDMVVLGAGTRISPHLYLKNAEGEMELVLATVRIGHRSLVGGYSLLAAGTEFAEDEVGRACLISPPYSRWKGGIRVDKGLDRP
jgi:hypothetical protein